MKVALYTIKNMFSNIFGVVITILLYLMWSSPSMALSLIVNTWFSQRSFIAMLHTDGAIWGIVPIYVLFALIQIVIYWVSREGSCCFFIDTAIKNAHKQATQELAVIEKIRKQNLTRNELPVPSQAPAEKELLRAVK